MNNILFIFLTLWFVMQVPAIWVIGLEYGMKYSYFDWKIKDVIKDILMEMTLFKIFLSILFLPAIIILVLGGFTLNIFAWVFSFDFWHNEIFK